MKLTGAGYQFMDTWWSGSGVHEQLVTPSPLNRNPEPITPEPEP
jgi:hypothetical protein